MGGAVYPCQAFYQGERLMLGATVPLQALRGKVQYNSATRRSTQAHGALNRPFKKEHALEIKEYVLANPRRYIMPAVTLNTAQMPPVFTVHSAFVAVRPAWIVLTLETVFNITDGQHRLAALLGHEDEGIAGAVTENPALARDGVEVLWTIEADIAQVHQDFADAAKAVGIPPALLAAFDTRDVANRITRDVVQRSALLRDRIDETSTGISKYAQELWVLSQIRSFLKILLLGDYAAQDDTFVREAAKRLGTPGGYEAFLGNVTELLDVLTAHMKPWNEIAPLRRGTEANVIPMLRQRYLNLSQPGLNVIG